MPGIRFCSCITLRFPILHTISCVSIGRNYEEKKSDLDTFNVLNIAVDPMYRQLIGIISLSC